MKIYQVRMAVSGIVVEEVAAINEEDAKSIASAIGHKGALEVNLVRIETPKGPVRATDFGMLSQD